MHRDVKPANLLIDRDCNVKVCDFGLARTTLEKPHGDEDGQATKKLKSDLSRNEATQNSMFRHEQTVGSRVQRKDNGLVLPPIKIMAKTLQPMHNGMESDFNEAATASSQNGRGWSPSTSVGSHENWKYSNSTK